MLGIHSVQTNTLSTLSASQEMFANGVANLAACVSSGYPAAGSFSRSALVNATLFYMSMCNNLKWFIERISGCQDTAVNVCDHHRHRYCAFCLDRSIAIYSIGIDCASAIGVFNFHSPVTLCARPLCQL